MLPQYTSFYCFMWQKEHLVKDGPLLPEDQIPYFRAYLKFLFPCTDSAVVEG